jgi:hypothetical protein
MEKEYQLYFSLFKVTFESLGLEDTAHHSSLGAHFIQM